MGRVGDTLFVLSGFMGVGVGVMGDVVREAGRPGDGRIAQYVFLCVTENVRYW